MGGRYVDHILYDGLANENAEKLNSKAGRATEDLPGKGSKTAKFTSGIGLEMYQMLLDILECNQLQDDKIEDVEHVTSAEESERFIQKGLN